MNKTLSVFSKCALAGGLIAAVAACGSDSSGDGKREVVVYTGRHYGIEAIFEEFTKDTGIAVRFTTGSDPELRERLIAEGDNTPADLVITADGANMQLSSAAGVLAPVDNDAILAAIPEDLRAADNTWFALSLRSRTIMYSKDRVTTPPTTYAELGDEAWKGRLCLRPSTHPYTQSLVAGLINNYGPDQAREIVDSWIANDPLYLSDDEEILEAIKDDECDVGLANSYYLGRYLTEDETFPVSIMWADQDGPGAHLNTSAAAVTASAPHKEEAIALLEWLATKGQKTFSDANNEFPADPTVDPTAVVMSFGPAKFDTKSVRELGRLNPDAVSLLSAAGYE